MRAKYTHAPWEREYIEMVNHNGKRKKIGEITRCNDCKYYVVVPWEKGRRRCVCRKWEQGTAQFPKPNDYCSRGETNDK